MAVNPSEIDEAVQCGYPTAKQRRTWTRAQWDEFNTKTWAIQEQKRLKYEAGNSNERLREMVDDLVGRVAALERYIESLVQAANRRG